MNVLRKLLKFIGIFLETRTLCTIKGIPIRMHVSFYGVILFMAYGVIRSYFDGNAEWVEEATNLFKFLILFSCVTIHELGHSLWAKKKGYPTKDILLIFIGGLARIDKLPNKPKEELGIAVAGPLTNVLIAFIFFVIALFLDYGLINWVWQINIAILIFNLVPAYPMDGGRIFRALLNYFVEDKKATKFASITALGFFSLFIFGGFYLKVYNLAFIGAFMALMLSIELVVRKKKPELLYDSYKEIETPLGTVSYYIDIDKKKFIVNGPEEAIAKLLSLHNKCAIPGCNKNPLKNDKAYLIDFEKGISACSSECREAYDELYGGHN